MAFFPFRRTSGIRRKKSSKAKAGDEKSELTLKLDAIKRQEQKIRDKADKAKRKVEDIPKILEERKRREQALIRDRARNSKTLRGLDKRTYKLPATTASRRMTLGQQRAMLTRFLLLCAALAILLVFLWRAAR